MSTSELYTGIVKSYNPEKGWGHIECAETHSLYGKDIFVLRSQVGADIQIAKGAQVIFHVAMGAKGPEASTLQVVPSSQQSRYVGTMKSWNPVKGWGHIECAETYEQYKKDMFVMKSALVGGTAQKGDEVSFTLVEGSKGPEAADVQIVNQASLGDLQMALASSGEGQYVGVVKSFNEEKGWGHITCDATHQIYGKDMFLLRSALNHQTVRPGDRVSFRVTEGTHGAEAAQVMHLNPRAAAGHFSASATRFSGSIKNYDAAKGWGFIMCEDSHTIYGKDIFLHSKDLGGYVPTAGEGVQFSVALGASGRPEATGVIMRQVGVVVKPPAQQWGAEWQWQPQGQFGVQLPKQVLPPSDYGGLRFVAPSVKWTPY